MPAKMTDISQHAGTQAFRRRWAGPGGYHEMLVVAVPLILSTGAWSVQHFVDRMFLAWYSAEALAASMPAGILNFAVLSLFIGTASYVSTFVAQYHGAGRQQRIGPALWQGIYVSALGGLFVLSLVPAAEGIFGFFGHDAEVQRLETEYFRILCLGGFPAIAASAMGGFFSGRGKTWPVMWVNTSATALNLFLDYLLIFGKWGLPEMGIRGAATATVISAVFSLAVYFLLVCGRGPDAVYRTLRGWRFDRPLFARLLRFGFPSGVQFCLEITGFTLFILLVGRLGVRNLAATNIAFNINTLAFMPMIGAGIAVSVLVGQYLGRGEPRLARRSAYSGFHLTFLYMGTVAAAYVLVPDIFIRPFAAHSDPETFREIYPLTVVLLRFVALYSIFDTLNIVFASAIKGAGDTRFVMFVLLVVTVGVLGVPAYVTVVVLGKGLLAAWAVVTVYVIVLGLIFHRRFLGGRWQEMRVIEAGGALHCRLRPAGGAVAMARHRTESRAPERRSLAKGWGRTRYSEGRDLLLRYLRVKLATEHAVRKD